MNAYSCSQRKPERLLRTPPPLPKKKPNKRTKLRARRKRIPTVHHSLQARMRNASWTAVWKNQHCHIYGHKKNGTKLYPPPPPPATTHRNFKQQNISKMGAIHKMAATLGDSPAARALRGNFYGQPGLPHLAKHFFPGFLVLLPVKKPHTNENLSGSTPPSRQNADFCFHRATISDTKRSERTCLCWQPMTAEQRRRWRRYFGKTELISMHRVTQRSQVSSTSRKTFFFVKFDGRTMETEHQLQFPMSSSHRCTHVPAS